MRYPSFILPSFNRGITRWVSSTLAVLFCLSSGARAAEPLHQKIDALIAKAHPEGQAAIVGDAEYLRRIYLALHGMIPTAAKAREFLADPAPDKRAKLVDALLADSQFAKWMAVTFDIMLMERRTDLHTKAQPWRDWIEESFRANKPWDALVREIITADGADDKTRHMARWMLERQVDPNALTKDLARVFLGRDLGCAQCHDHPRIDDYHQRDYAGIQAFFSRTYLFQPDKKKPAVVAEQAAGETSYLSVFTKVGGDTKPRLPGAADITDPSKGEWTVAPNDKDKNLRPIPKQSRRALLATALGEGKHPAFRRNIANRLWAVVFGRGLVEPLDLQHSANPPSNPELMDLLGDQIAVMKFDMRAFVRELALTQAFQRTLDIPEVPADVAKAAEKLPALEKEATTLADSLVTLEENFKKEQKKLVEVQLAAEPTRAELIKLEAAKAAAQKGADDAAAPLKKAEDALKPKRDALDALHAEESKLKESNANAESTPAIVAAEKALQKKLDAATKEVTALEKDVATKKAAFDAKAQILVAAQQKAAETKAKMDAFAKGIATQQALFSALETRKETERTKAKDVAALAAQLKAALELSRGKAGEKSASEAREALAAAWGRSFAANELQPLTPEQLCWSALQATGQLESLRKTSATQWDAKNKPTEEDKADPKKQAERSAGIEVLLREKLRGYEDQFIRSFAGAAGQPQTDFFATPEQTLYFENGGVLRGWCAVLAGTVAAKSEPRAMAEELYLSTLTRMPVDEEIADLTAVIAARPPDKKAEALTDYAWALITSVEFRFSH